MREKLYIQKLWNSFMRKKMEQQMKKSEDIDIAFKEIKTETRVTDVQEVVKKFLTRESTYSQLLSKVSEFERHMENLKKDNEVLKTRLDELHIDTNEVQNEPDDHKFQDDEEIMQLRQNIEAKKRDFQFLQEKYKKINIVNDQITGWARRVNHKFGALTNDFSLQAQNEDITKIFMSMEKIVVAELTELKERSDENPVEADDQFIDFATEEFIMKNIRVRPISGATHADETKDGRQSNVSKGGENDPEKEAAKAQFEAEMELNDQRAKVKEAADLYKRAREKALAAEEKKKNKK